MKNKILSLALALGLVGVFAGCSNDDGARMKILQKKQLLNLQQLKVLVKLKLVALIIPHTEINHSATAVVVMEWRYNRWSILH